MGSMVLLPSGTTNSEDIWLARSHATLNVYFEGWALSLMDVWNISLYIFPHCWIICHNFGPLLNPMAFPSAVTWRPPNSFQTQILNSRWVQVKENVVNSGVRPPLWDTKSKLFSSAPSFVLGFFLSAKENVFVSLWETLENPKPFGHEPAEGTPKFLVFSREGVRIKP